MAEPIPSGYLIDRAAKAKNEELLDKASVSMVNRHEIESLLASGLSAPERGENALSVPLDKPSVQEAIENETDITLTELEKSLTDRQRKFAWNLASARASGKVSLRQCALDAGYSEANAGNAGSEMARNPVICRVVADRMPTQLKLKAVKERGPDYVIEKAVTILERALQERPVLDKNGNPTGYYMYDGALAKSTLDSLANWMGMTKQKVELGGTDGEAIKVDSRVVVATVLSMKDRMAALKKEKLLPPVEDSDES